MNPLAREPYQVYPIPPDKQDEICSLIANGIPEEEACAKAVVPYSDFLAAEITDGKFFDKLSQAFKRRADHWVTKIIKDIDDIPDKFEAPGKKIQFEKIKWLAEIDNPDKYGKKTSTTLDINHNVTLSVKNMSIADARKVLAEDPFSVPLEADYQKINESIVEASIVEKPKKEYPL